MTSVSLNSPTKSYRGVRILIPHYSHRPLPAPRSRPRIPTPNTFVRVPESIIHLRLRNERTARFDGTETGRLQDAGCDAADVDAKRMVRRYDLVAVLLEKFGAPTFSQLGGKSVRASDRNGQFVFGIRTAASTLGLICMYRQRPVTGTCSALRISLRLVKRGGGPAAHSLHQHMGSAKQNEPCN
jgi:hypothetical protein